MVGGRAGVGAVGTGTPSGGVQGRAAGGAGGRAAGGAGGRAAGGMGGAESAAEARTEAQRGCNRGGVRKMGTEGGERMDK